MADLLSYVLLDFYKTASDVATENERLREIVSNNITRTPSYINGIFERLALREMLDLYASFLHGVDTPPPEQFVNSVSAIMAIDPMAFLDMTYSDPEKLLKVLSDGNFAKTIMVMGRMKEGLNDGQSLLTSPTLAAVYNGVSLARFSDYVNKYRFVINLMVDPSNPAYPPEAAVVHAEYGRVLDTTLTGVCPLKSLEDMRKDAVASAEKDGYVFESGDLEARRKAEETRWHEIPVILADFNNKVGLSDAKQYLSELKANELFRMNRNSMQLADNISSRHVFMEGPPGTGKSTTVEAMFKIWQKLGVARNGPLVKVTAADLIAGFVGQTRQQTRKVIDDALAKSGVLFIDEAYSLAAGNAYNGSTSFAKEALDEIVEAMEFRRKDLIVVFAGYNGDMGSLLEMNRGLKSRIGKFMQFPSYSQDELMRIMDGMAKDMDLRLSGEARTKAGVLLEGVKRVEGDNFGNARTVRTLLEHAQRQTALRLDRAGALPFVSQGTTEADTLMSAVSRAKLMLITLEDMTKVQIGQLGGSVPKVTLGFRGDQQSKQTKLVVAPRPTPIPMPRTRTAGASAKLDQLSS